MVTSNLVVELDCVERNEHLNDELLNIEPANTIIHLGCRLLVRMTP